MATSIRLRGGTTSQHSSFTGAAKEVTVDTDKNTIVVHDGSTAGGFPLVAKDRNGDVTVPDDEIIQFGTGNDLKIYHSSSNNSSYISELGTGDLNISGTIMSLKASNNHTYIRCVEDSYVRLYHDNATVLQTQSNGIDVTGELIADSYNETYAALSGTSPAVNCETGNSFSLVLSGNSTFTFTNPPASGTAYSFSVEIIQDSGASGYTVTWPSSVDWPAATAPTLTATASAKDIFVFTTRDGGTNWYGFTAGQALG